MLYANFYTDAGGREARLVLRELGNDVCDLEGVRAKCPEGAVAVFTSESGSYTGKHLRHGTIASLEARGMKIPAWARNAAYAIALKEMPFNGLRAKNHAARFKEALRTVSRRLKPEPSSTKVKKARSQWTSGHHAQRRRMASAAIGVSPCG